MPGRAPGYNAIFRAIANPRRRQIVRLLLEREMCIDELAEHLCASKATTVRYLRALSSAGLVRAERQKVAPVYKLNVSKLENAWAELRLKDGIRGTTDEKPLLVAMA